MPSATSTPGTDTVLEAYAAAVTAGTRVKELKAAAERAVEALEAASVSAGRVTMDRTVEAPEMFWFPAIKHAEEVRDYIADPGDGSNFDFDFAVKLAADLERFFAVAAEETDKNVGQRANVKGGGDA